MKLLDESPEVNDKPNASTLHVENGEIEFGAVSLALFVELRLIYSHTQRTLASHTMVVRRH